MADLPTGVSNAEAKAIFDKLVTDAETMRSDCISTRVPDYLRDAVATGALPVAVTQTEFDAIMASIANGCAIDRDQYVTAHTPDYLLPNIADFVTAAQAEATIWQAKVLARGGTVSPGRMAGINALIGSLKKNNIWGLLDRLWIFAGENEQQSLIDLVTASIATPVGSPTFTANRGYQGSGTGYINSGYNPSTGPNFTLNSGSIFVYENTSRSGANMQSGAFDGTNGVIVAPSDTGAIGRTRINMTNATDAGGTVPGNTGLSTGSRTSSTAVAFYHDGTQVGSTLTTASTTIPDFNLFFGAVNNAGAPAAFDIARIAVGGAGAGLSAENVSALNAIVVTYLTAVGAQA